MLKVQFGCGLSQPSGWENYDSSPSLFIARIPLSRSIAKAIIPFLGKNNFSDFKQIFQNIASTKALYGDVIKGLPLKSNSVDLLYASHVLEHIPFRSFQKSLKECRRILNKEGIFRLCVPDFKYYINNYLNSKSNTKSIDFCLDTLLGMEYYPNIFTRMRGDKHQIMFDEETLYNQLELAGFHQIRSASFGDSTEKAFLEVEEEISWQKPQCIGFECKK